MAATKFQKLQKAATGVCSGKVKITTVRTLAKEYVKDATDKGATKAAAEKTANNQLKRATKCSMSKVSGVKRKKTTTKAKAKTTRKTTKRK